jgi:uncharacterized membrane protein
LFKFDRIPWLCVLLIGLGTGLRLALLDAKPPWNDELATLVFSLGNSLRSVPIDQPIALDTLLAPLRPNPANTLRDVVTRLFTESTHPPVYFVLTHLWLQLFPTDHGLVSVWAARSLSALLGVAAIPAMWGLGWLTWRSKQAGQMAAALMAVSPYGIYLAQEARHYTLAVLWIIASLSCLISGIRSIVQTPLPLWRCLVWVGVNSLGTATHYFFTLVLAAEAIALAPLWILSAEKWGVAWRRIGGVAIATCMSLLAWLPMWGSISGNELTQWIYDKDFLSNWIAPLGRLVAWMLTMVMLLPVEGVPLGVAIAAGAVLGISLFWLLPPLSRGMAYRLSAASTHKETQALLRVWLGAIVLMLCLTYGFQADLTIAARYQFIYFPAFIVLVAGAVVPGQPSGQSSGQPAKVLLLLGLMGSLTVISNYGYQKPDRPDQLVPIIRSVSAVPVLIATAHQTHEQTRELMGLALEYHRQFPARTGELAPQFLLAHLAPDSNSAVEVLQKTVEQMPRPFDVWTVNFLPTVQPELKTCLLDTADRPLMHGYDYRLYHCLGSPSG